MNMISAPTRHALALAIVMALAACGGGSSSPATPAPVTPPEEAAIARQLDDAAGSATAPTAWDAAGSKVTYHDDANVASYAVISNFGANDTIALSAAAQNAVSVSSQGSNVTLTVNRNGVISNIVLQNVISAGQVVFDVASFNALPVGDIGFTGNESVQAVALDSRGGTLSVPANVDAANGSFVLTDDALLPSVVRLAGFGANDTLQWRNASAGQVAVSSKGGDAVLVVNQAGVVSSVTIVGVVPAGAVVYDLASFNALAVGKILF